MELLALLPTLLGLGTSLFQGISAGKASDEAGARPAYKTPPEIDQAVNIAKQQAYGEMPGLQTAKQNIEQQGASQYNKALETASSGSDVLGFMSGQSLGMNRAMNQLSDANAAYKDQGLDKLKGTLGMKAQYSNMEQQDQLNRWQELKSEQAVEEEGAIQNAFGAVSGLSSNLIGMKQNKEYMDLLKMMYGNQGQQTQQPTAETNYEDMLKKAKFNLNNYFDPTQAMYDNLW